ncbi:MAG: response regulator [Gammaproteobacteria bacterium]|nr:response regulator [Gammaproteobacteria bacterium]
MGNIHKCPKINKLYKVTCLLWLCFVFVPLQAVNLKSYTTNDGLLQNSGTAFVTDNDGFLWIGTELGISRFDGYEFQSYPIKDRNFESVPFSSVNTLYLDGNNTVWAGLHVGIAKLDRSQEIFKVQPSRRDAKQSNEKELIPFQPSSVIGIEESHNKQLWIGHSTGFFVNSLSGWIYDDAGLEDQEYLSSFIWLDDSCLLVGSDHRLYRYCPKSRTIENLLSSEAIFSESNHYYPTTMLKDNDGIVWIGIRHHGIYKYNPITNKISKFDLNLSEHNRLETSRIIQDSNLNLWVGSYDQGLFKVNKERRELVKIAEQSILSLMSSDNGDVWIGTYREGLRLYSPSLNRFKHLHPQTLSNNSVKSNNVVATEIDGKGRIWTSVSNEGVMVFENEQLVEHFNIANGLLSNDITEIKQSHDQKIWLASFEGITIYDLNTQEFSYLTSNLVNMSFLKNSAFFGLTFDKNGHAWLSKWQGGLYRVNDNSVDHFDSEFFDKSYRYTNTFLDHDENLWAIHESGLSKFNYNSQTFEHYLVPNQNRPLAAYEHFLTKNNKIYLISRTAIYIFDFAKQTFENLEDPLFIDDYTIYSGFEGKNGDLWLGTERGLINFDDGIVKEYSLIDGIQGLEFNSHTSLGLPDGRIAMGGVNGISIWSPDDFVLTPSSSDIVVSDSKLLTMEGEKRLEISNNLIFLKSTQRDLSLTLTSLNYAFAEKIKYAYRILGVTDWISLNKDREVSFIQFPYGENVVELKSTNQVGQWDNQVTKLTIEIEKPFWMRWYFIFLCCLMLALSIYFTHRLRVKRLQNRSQLLEALVKDRTCELQTKTEQLVKVSNEKEDFFANVSHEIKTPLTLILGPLDTLIKSSPGTQIPDELNIIKRNSQRLLKLVNQLLSVTSLSNVSEGNWAFMNDEAYNFENHRKELALLANQKNISLVFDGELSACPLSPEDLEVVESNLISNAIKYSPKGTVVNIKCYVSEDNFIIDVCDQGIGISDSNLESIFKRYYRVNNPKVFDQSGTGLGLSIVDDIAQKYQGGVEAKNNIDIGSTFIFKCPLAESVSFDNEQKVINIDDNYQSSDEQAQSTKIIEKKVMLIVDDNADMRDYINSILSERYECLLAADAISAYEIALAHVPDFIISDINMLPVDGFEFCKMIKGNQVTSHIPIMMLTADGSESRKLKSLQLKANYFLTKPFSRDELVLICQNTLSHRSDSAKKLEIQLSKNFDIAEDIATIQNDEDKEFTSKLDDLIEINVDSASLSTDSIANAFNMSTRQLQRKIKTITGFTPLEYVRRYKLSKAMVLLKQGHSIKTVSFDLGFSSVAYFTRCFKEEFKVTPKEFVNSNISIDN